MLFWKGFRRILRPRITPQPSPRGRPEPRGCPGGGWFRSPSSRADAGPTARRPRPPGEADPGYPLGVGRPRCCGSPASRGVVRGRRRVGTWIILNSLVAASRPRCVICVICGLLKSNRLRTFRRGSWPGHWRRRGTTVLSGGYRLRRRSWRSRQMLREARFSSRHRCLRSQGLRLPSDLDSVSVLTRLEGDERERLNRGITLCTLSQSW